MVFLTVKGKKNKGFTLVELLVVIAIIGILAAVIAPKVFAAIDKGKVAVVVQDIEAIKTAAFVFYADTGQFPQGAVSGPQSYNVWNADSKALFVDGESYSHGGTTNNYSAIASRWGGPYLDKWPTSTPLGGVYAYRYIATGTTTMTWAQANLRNIVDNQIPPPNNNIELLYIRFNQDNDRVAKRDKLVEHLREYIDPQLIYTSNQIHEGNNGLIAILLRKH